MTESDMGDWDRLSTGEIETAPVVGWAVAAMPLNVMLRLEILMETGQIGSAQVHIPANQVPELAEALLGKAERAMSSDGSGRT
jgi:hypothetical protein